jgi:hypothetical protein
MFKGPARMCVEEAADMGLNDYSAKRPINSQYQNVLCRGSYDLFNKKLSGRLPAYPPTYLGTYSPHTHKAHGQLHDN